MGLNPEIENILRLGRLDPTSHLNQVPKEILNQIIFEIVRESIQKPQNFVEISPSKKVYLYTSESEDSSHQE